MREKIYDLREFPIGGLRDQLATMSDADVVGLMVNDDRPTAQAAYNSRLGRELYVAVVDGTGYGRGGQELELPDGTSVVWREVK